jgi:CRISPR-associated protein Cmr1
MRTINATAPTLKPPDDTTWTLELRTITPMFGGSATPREVDTDHPVRAASVRGHLRFWWRATAGARYESAKELFEAEEKIWGSAEKPGSVALRVNVTQPGSKKPCAKFPDGKVFPNFGSYPGYALFPFQGKARRDKQSGRITIEEQPADCITSIEFALDLTYPKAIDLEIRNAVWAWVQFGGIGARTRRGCGSLEFVEAYEFSGETRRIHPNLLTLVPVVCLVGESDLDDAVSAWRQAVEVYKEFRQGKGFARNPGSDPQKPAKLGRSKYPEPDSIRALYPHERWTHSAEHPVRGFPRADLGLPIVFHFQEEGPRDENFTLELNASGQSRFASPVITKPIKVRDGYAPALMLLDSPHVWEMGDLKLSLKRDVRKLDKAQVGLGPSQLAEIAPLSGLPIREALIDFAKSKKKFKEVRL